MVPSGHSASITETLLYHGPVPLVTQDEAVEVDLKSVLDGCVVHLGAQPAAPYKRLSLEPGSVGVFKDLLRCGAGAPTFAAADVDAQLFSQRIDGSLESAHDRSGDTGRMPVHAQNASQSLKPEGIAQPAEQFALAVRLDDSLDSGKDRIRTSLSR